MKAVNAPDGFEGCRFFDAGAKEWMASAKPNGATWWTNVGLVGHAHVLDEELDQRAAERIIQAVALGRVK
jgi:hypothetical protein